MARKRMIDPTIWADAGFGSLSRDAQILFIGMISNADDDGILPANSLYLTATILPYDGISKEKATKIRDEVVQKMKSLVLYRVDDKEYIQFKKWKYYQKVDRPQASKYPKFDDHSTILRELVPPNRIEQNRIEQNRIKESIKESPPLSELLLKFNSLFNKDYKPTRGRADKLRIRMQSYSLEQILQAIENLSKNRFYHGKNDRGWSASPDFILASDEVIDKWLNSQTKKSSGALSDLLPD